MGRYVKRNDFLCGDFLVASKCLGTRDSVTHYSKAFMVVSDDFFEKEKDKLEKKILSKNTKNIYAKGGEIIFNHEDELKKSQKENMFPLQIEYYSISFEPLEFLIEKFPDSDIYYIEHNKYIDFSRSLLQKGLDSYKFDFTFQFKDKYSDKEINDYLTKIK